MGTIRRFEDLPVWQNARELADIVYRLSRGRGFGLDFALRDQIQRSVISVMSNIAEGFESQSDRQFISYLFRARASAGEVRCQSYVALDQKYITEAEFEQVLQKSLKTSRMIAGLISYLQSGDAGLQRKTRL